MILLELIFPEQDKRLFLSADRSVTVGELKGFVRRFFDLKNSRILFVTGTDPKDEMTLFEAGFFTGTGVIICECTES